MIIIPRRLFSKTSPSTPSRFPAIKSNIGVRATNRCNAERPPPDKMVNFHSLWYELKSLVSFVLAVNSIMIGASIRRDNGKTTPP